MKTALINVVLVVGPALSVLAFHLFERAKTPRQYLAAWAFQFIAQPFWLANTYLAGQWGMFAVSLAFTFVAARGVLRFALEVRALDERTLS